MIMIQSRRREKKATIKDVKLSHKGPLPTCTSFLHTPKILKLSQKLTFPTEIEPTTCSAKKRGSKKSEKKKERGKELSSGTFQALILLQVALLFIY